MPLIEIDDTWEYQIVAANTVPADPTAWVVPSSGYSFSQAPFGTLGALATEHPINTDWPLGNGLWIRRNVTLDGLAPVLIWGRIKNALWAYWDGQFIGTVNPSNSNRPETPYWYLVVPQSLAGAGVHQLALYCTDEAGTGPDGTTYVFCEADYIPAFLAVPPQSPVRETLAWKTDVIESFDGTEERLQVRGSPRQSFRYNYPVRADRTAYVFNTLYGARAEKWLLPIWTQAQRLGAVAAGLSVLPATTNTFEFRPSSLAVLWENTEKWQLLGVDLVGGSTLTLVGLTQAFDNAWLMPVRFARIANNVEKQTNGYNAHFEVTYDVMDNASLTVDDPAQFLGEDLYTDEILLAGASLTDSLIRRVEVHDEDLGVVSFRSPWEVTRVSRPHRKVAANAAEAWALRQWLHRRAGRYRAFWQPSFEADLRLLSTGTITNALIVSPDEYRRHASDRVHIAVETADGSWYARTITGVEQLDANRIQLTLDSALNISASSVLRVCYLGLKRLDSDRVEIDWPGGGVAQVGVQVMELSP